MSFDRVELWRTFWSAFLKVLSLHEWKIPLNSIILISEYRACEDFVQPKEGVGFYRIFMAVFLEKATGFTRCSVWSYLRGILKKKRRRWILRYISSTHYTTYTTYTIYTKYTIVQYVVEASGNLSCAAPSCRDHIFICGVLQPSGLQLLRKQDLTSHTIV